MRVVLIRHAESTNNAIEDDIRQRIREGKLPPEKGYPEFVKRRHHDPYLSPKGYQQAEALASAYGHLDTSELVLYSSAVRRSLETVAPLAKRLGSKVTVMPHLYESGGIFNNPHENHRLYEPAPGMTVEEIRSTYDFMDVTNLPPKGPWNQMRPFEDRQADIRRALKVASWLLSPQFFEAHRGKFVLIVTHSEFMDLVTTALMDPLIFATHPEGFTHTQEEVRLVHAFQNTSLTSFDITLSKEPNVKRPNVRMLYLNRIDHLPFALGGRIDNGKAKL